MNCPVCNVPMVLDGMDIQTLKAEEFAFNNTKSLHYTETTAKEMLYINSGAVAVNLSTM